MPYYVIHQWVAFLLQPVIILFSSKLCFSPSFIKFCDFKSCCFEILSVSISSEFYAYYCRCSYPCTLMHTVIIQHAHKQPCNVISARLHLFDVFDASFGVRVMLCCFRLRWFREHRWCQSDRSRWLGWSDWWLDRRAASSWCYCGGHCTAQSTAAAAADQLTVRRLSTLSQSPPGNDAVAAFCFACMG